MNSTAVRILLLGQDPSDAQSVREALANAGEGSFIVDWEPRLADGLERLSGNEIAAVLLDLGSPDWQGSAALDEIRRVAPHVPVLVIGLPDDAVVRQAVACGAQDYIRRDRLDSYTLPRALTRIIDRHTAEEALHFEQQRAEITLNSIGDAVLSTDLSNRVTYLNPVAERMTAWSRQEALGQPLLEVFRIVDSTTRETARNPMEEAIEFDRVAGLTPNCILVGRDGTETAIADSASPIHDRRGHVIGAVIVFRDVSVARAAAVEIVHLAQHDVLTDLPNRLLLSDRLAQAITLVRRHRQHLAVLYLDLDRFKHVNDSLGHVVGDGLLQSVARRLLTCVRASDTVSRQGGDEFLVLLSEIARADDAAATARKMIAALVAPHDIASHVLHITGTIGISVYPEDGGDAETLIKCADTAMYHAKERGRNCYQFFERNMHARAVERQRIEAGLHLALARHEFVLHYQPKVDLGTGMICGTEALLRWVHPKRGLLPPKEFVPIAEDCGLMVPIGRWVLGEACRQARAWIDEGRPPMAVAVNISAVEFTDPGFLDHLRRVLLDTGLDARYLEIELTETALFQHDGAPGLVLQALKEMGVQVAIDDFGTGYSSLSYLRNIPVSVLKIDRSFVHEISAVPVGSSIVCAVISMAKSLGLRVVAEGVETKEQLKFLQAEGCAEGQGFYFSRPLGAGEFAALPATAVSGVWANGELVRSQVSAYKEAARGRIQAYPLSG
jgi:diguanylate cyclase (GGDEF)-like protein/PAS domain S-box-containing protein